MALPLSNNAEGGTDTTNVTAANSGGASGDAFNTVTQPGGTGGSLTYSTDHPADGPLGWKFACPTGSGFGGEIIWSTAMGTVTEVYGRIYTYRTSINSDTNRIFLITNGGSRAAEVDITTTGKLRTFNSANATIATSTNDVPLNELVRIEFHYLASATVGRMEAKFFHGHATTSIEDVAMAVDANTSTQATDVRLWGTPSAVTSGYTWYADAWALSATDWIGPADNLIALQVPAQFPSRKFGPF